MPAKVAFSLRKLAAARAALAKVVRVVPEVRGRPQADQAARGGKAAANIIEAHPPPPLRPAKGWLAALAAASSAGKIKIGAGLAFRRQLINHWHVVPQAVARVAREPPGRRKVEATHNHTNLRMRLRDSRGQTPTIFPAQRQTGRACTRAAVFRTRPRPARTRPPCRRT